MNHRQYFFLVIAKLKENSFLFLAILIICLPLQVLSQEKVTTQLWSDMALFNEYNQQLDFYGDFGYRIRFGDEVLWNRVYVRPAAKYSPVKWLGIRAGVALFYTKFPSREDGLELRPWQGISIGWPKFPRMKFSHYFRLEQRIFYETQDWKRTNDLRFRYQLSGRFKPNANKEVKYLYFPAFIEFFASNDETVDNEVDIFANELRTSFGIGYTLNKYWSWQLVLIYQKSRNQLAEFETTDLIFRLSIRHELVPLKDEQRLEE